MSTKLIQTKDYLLLIDEEAEVCRGQHRFLNNEVELIHEGHNYPYKGNKVIAYYLLTKEAKELDLPLLPVTPRNEWGVHETHCCSKHGCKYGDNDCCVELGIAKQRYPCEDCNDEEEKFSLEDVKKAIDLTQQICDRNAHYVQRDRNVHVPMISVDEEEEIIQSLSTQQLPKEFIPTLESKCWCLKPMSGGCFECSNILKTITNSEGKEELVGTYKY